jgi:TRAP-type uncharacterized transport system substrate-binding protein
MVWPGRFGKRVRDGLLGVVGVAALSIAAFYALYKPPVRTVALRLTAGRAEGTRHRIAQALQRAAEKRRVEIELHETAGSAEALRAVASAQVDLAFVQGGLTMEDHPGLRQVAVLNVEPLHLLVKPEIYHAVTHSLRELRGKVVNVSEPGSGTYLLATEVMEFLRLRAGSDYTATTLTYDELVGETDRARLPDAVFSVSTLPSPIARHLVSEHDFRLVSLPLRDAFALGVLDTYLSPPDPLGERPTQIDRRHVHDATIPAFAYGIEPGVPPELIHTLGTRLLLIAREEMAPTKIRRLLEVVFNPPFSQALESPLDVKLLESPPELPWHDGTIDYVRRNPPLIVGDVIDLVEKELSILGVLAGGLFCLSQWLRRRYRWRRERGFEAYILQIAQVERLALALSRAPTLDLAALLQLQDDVTRIKGEALERFAEGKLEGEELMSGFLAHASDARVFLLRLILHQRDNLEERARTLRQPAEALWNEAVGGINHQERDT